MTNWYPTEKNPFAGLFFREQAIATQEHLDYLVIHYIPKYRLGIECLVRKVIKKGYELNVVKREFNIEEYNVIDYYPLYLWIVNALHDIYIRRISKQIIQGVGRYQSELYIEQKKKKIKKIFGAEFKNKIDVFYCVDAQNEASTIQFAAQALDKPYICGEHGPFPWIGTTLVDTEKLAMEQADLFLAISHDKVRQVLMQNIKLPKIEYIGNMINDDQFELHRGNDIKTFIIVAAHSFYKNYDMFVDIMNRLVKITDKDFKVMIVGYGANQGYAQGIEEFEKQIESSEFADKAIMIPKVPHEKIQECFLKADAFIMTSIQEGMPVSALEAACCGLPIFSTRCGGVEDFVNDDIGRIFNLLEIEEFAKTLNDYLQGKIEFDPHYIRQKVVEQYGKDTFVKKFVQIVYNMEKE